MLYNYIENYKETEIIKNTKAARNFKDAKIKWNIRIIKY